MTSLESQGISVQFVTFYVGKEKFAVPVDIVREIVRQSKFTKLPLSPNYVEGITNLRGEVLPVINLRKRLNLDDSMVVNPRVVVINQENRTFGLIVDKTAQVIDVTSEEFKESGTRSEFIKMVIQKRDDFYLVLDIDKLVDVVVSKKASEHSPTNPMTSSVVKSQEISKNEYVQLVSFDLNNQTYAFKIDQVQEIIRYKEPTTIPNAEECIRGVINLRNAVLPIVDLKKLLYSQYSESNSFTKVVITKVNKSLVGFIIDKINEVLKVEKTKILPPPHLKTNENEEVIGVVNQDDKMIILLEPSKLLGNSISELYEMKEREQISAAVEEEMKYVVFKVCDTFFGVPIEEVQEINKLSKLTKLPNAPYYVEGLMNLRGEVLPVVDLKKRLNLTSCTLESKVSERVLVYELPNKSKVAFIVDLVEGVEKFSKDIIEDSVHLMGENVELIPQIIKAVEKTVLVINLLAVFSQSEIEKISNVIEATKSSYTNTESSIDNTIHQDISRTHTEEQINKQQKRLKKSR